MMNIKILEVGKYYYSVRQYKYESDEIIILGESNTIPKKIIIEHCLVPFKVNKIEAINIITDEELSLTDDSFLRNEKGNLKHNEFDIEIGIDIALEEHSIDELIDSFLDLTDKKEIEKFENDYKEFSEYMNKKLDYYNDINS